MINADELKKVLFQIAPVELAEEWDNVGIMVNSGKETDKILFALDCTKDVVEEAKRNRCGIVVTHHPFIFHGVKSISSDSALYAAIHEDISVLSIHTNYDSTVNGVNDVLCERLELENVTEAVTLGRKGYLHNGPTDLRLFCSFVKERLGVSQVSVVDAGKQAHSVMVVGGSGGDFITVAKELGCDTLVTGEAAHHEGIDAHVLGINLVVAGHYATENPSIPNLCKLVQEKIGNTAECFVSVFNRDPYLYI